MLAEATRDLGGRVRREATLPGMSEYIRVRDYREQQLLKMPNVEVFRESRLTAEDVMAVQADHVAIATGGTDTGIWRLQEDTLCVDFVDGGLYTDGEYTWSID
jgi:hypothetical protein